MTGREIRLGRLLPKDQRSIIVAVDHGQTFGPMEGLIDFTAAAERLREADGVLLAPQMVRFSGTLFQGRHRPTMIVRLNWNSVHCEPWHYQQAHIVRTYGVRQAVSVGADAVLASLVLQTGSEAHDAHNVEVFARVAEETYDLGIPLIGEVFPVGGLRENAGAFHDYVTKVCRIACELGADAIKTFYTGEGFAEVTGGVPIPVLALGADKLEREIDALELARKAVVGGAAGVVFGRNVVQAGNPSQFLRGLKDVVQGRATPAHAAAQYGLAENPDRAS